MTRAEFFEIDEITNLAMNQVEWEKVYGKKTLAQVLSAKTKKDLATINFGEEGKMINGRAMIKTSTKKVAAKKAKSTVSAELLEFMKKKGTTKKVVAKKSSSKKSSSSADKFTCKKDVILGQNVKRYFNAEGKQVKIVYCGY